MAPPPFGDEWDDEAKAVIYLRGALSIDMGSAYRAVGWLQLAELGRRLRGPRVRPQPP